MATIEEEQLVDGPAKPAPKLPPPWVIHGAWRVHRGLYKLTRGRFLWTTSNKRGWGALHLTTVGRKSGQVRKVIVGYLEDGPNLVLLAMNGWDEGHPAWWLNLKAHPEAVVRIANEKPRPMRAIEVTGDERERLWQLWQSINPDLEGYASRRTTQTPVIILEPVG